MSDGAAAAAIPPSVARRCRLPVQGESRRRCAPSGLDSLVHSQYARRPAVPQRPLRDGENFGGGVSFRTSLSLHSSGRDVRFIARPPPRSLPAAFPPTAPSPGGERAKAPHNLPHPLH